MRTLLTAGVLVVLLLLGSFQPRAVAQGEPTMLGWFERVNLQLRPEQRREAARELIHKGTWAEWAQHLGTVLARDYKSGYVDQQPWVSRLRWAQLCDMIASFRNPQWVVAQPETLVQVFENERLLDALMRQITPLDAKARVLRLVLEMQQAEPEAVRDYPELVAAIALVHDQALPKRWPHRQVEQSAIQLAPQPWVDLLRYFVAQDRAGKLLWPLRELRVDQLRFVVDLPITLQEIAEVESKVKLSRNAFNKAFDLIRYDFARLRNQEYDWPHPSYRLRTILEIGGICVDQAYFACMVGKGRGLPTLYFEGQGRHGGHAWFGFLKENDAWNLEAGRYREQQYVTGKATDPQTWQTINDHELRFLSGTAESRLIFNYSRNLVALAQLKVNAGQPALRREILEQALKVNSTLPMVWEAVEQALLAAGGEDEHETNPPLQQHYRRMIAQFTQQDDVRAAALHKLERWALRTGNAAELAWVQQQVRTLRSDLLVSWVGSRLEHRAEKLASLPPAERAPVAKAIAQETEEWFDTLSKGGRTKVGGNVCYDLVIPVVWGLWESGETVLARQLLDRGRRLFESAQDSIILQSLLSLRETIAEEPKPSGGEAKRS